MQDKVVELINKTKDLNWQEKLQYISDNVSNVSFSTSFSLEDQIIFDYIAKNNLKVEIFTLDTGRLPKETYELWHKTLEQYNKKITPYYPDSGVISSYVANNGINAFYESVDLRKECCNIRKVEPLSRALSGKEIWISGIRKTHTKNRQDKDFFEFDANFEVIKFYPVLDFTDEEIWDYTKKHNIAYNKLYDNGYKSIGCDPCSRAVKEDEDARAGRWWWEDSGNQECGLHMVDGKLVRKNNKKEIF